MKIIVLLSFSVLISIYKVVGVTYNVGVDFNRTLMDCEGESTWIPIEYSEVGLKGPLENKKGIRASESSCATSFPVTLVPGTNFDITVFLGVEEDKSGLHVLITDENRIPIIKYLYNRTAKDYIPGWCKLSFSIKDEGLGYIILFGYSRHNEIVFVDSIQYILKTDQIENIFDNKDVEYAENNYEILIGGNEMTDDVTNPTKETGISLQTEGNDLDDNGENDSEEEEEIVSSEEILNTTELVTEETTTTTEQIPIITNPPEEIRECLTVGPWIIVLLVVAFVTLMALVAIGFYHLGKNKGLAENPLIYDDIQEPRSVVSIPRVRGVAESPIHIIDRPEFN